MADDDLVIASQPWADSRAEADHAEFLALLATKGDGDGPSSPLFADGASIAVARAPGRLDVMGGIADYSGSLVLQWPIREATLAAIQGVDVPGLEVVSLMPGSGPREARRLSIDGATLDGLIAGDYAAARLWFAADPSRHWAAYVVGIILVLARELGRKFSGLKILVSSRVPEAKGVSSSAALEVATMQAACGLAGITLAGAELARLCQMAENFVVGAPCGIMDQMTSALGRADALLGLRCQPAEVQGFIPLDLSIRFWGIDSGIRHAVSGSDYTSVRTGAFMGYRIIAELAGLPITPGDEPGVVRVDDPRGRGYLVNIAPGRFEREFARNLPAVMTGADFLARYGGITDVVTRVDPNRTYAVRQPTAHPIHEHDRVVRFAELLEGDPGEESLIAMGTLMYESHASYTACGLGSDGTDLLVDLVRAEGPWAGLYGAKITGGGSGGTVAVLGRADAGEAVDRVERGYRERTGLETYVFAGSSPGSCGLGARRLVL